jgi:hypothetical protein
MDNTSDDATGTAIEKKQGNRLWDQVNLERQIILARSSGETVEDTTKRLKISRSDYWRHLRMAAKRASAHLADETAMHLLSVMNRLDRATFVALQQMEAGEMRAGNVLANLVNSSANLVKVIMPQQIQDSAAQIPAGELLVAAARLGIATPRPLLE